MKFIRLDVKGTWKGTKHISSMANTEESENGISCYSLHNETDENILNAVKDLFQYWTNIASMSDFSDFQLTIFKGEKMDWVGYDMEDIASCTKTIKEVDAEPFMQKLFDIDDMKDGLYEDENGDYLDEISEDEADKMIVDLFKKIL